MSDQRNHPDDCEPDPAAALLVENRTLVCEPCVGAIALEARVAEKQGEKPH